ncbi:MAG TPA: lamin tail domain-containing protein [Pyrinomonadaceae bacterium]|nr:lamin tail domain-containing protein [Pyrinomonadaceae bacterium]
MLRLTTFFLITVSTFIVFAVYGPGRVQSFATLTRLTNTPEHVLNLNPTISDDGRTIVFESSADLANTGGSASFRLLRTDPSLTEIGKTRAVCPAISSDGRIVAFASREDLVGRNADRNSEIYLFDGVKLNQLTETVTTDGNFQPSISSDGRSVAFSSNGEIVVYDTLDRKFTSLGSGVSPKISGDGSKVYYKRKNLNTDDADLVRIDTRTFTSRVLAVNVVELSLVEGRAVSNDGIRVVYSAATGLNQTQVFMFDGRDESIRQLTNLGSRAVDVGLQPTISGDGRRVAFATRRRVVGPSDGGVELYVLDLPTGVFQQVTNAPSTATAEVVSSLNFDGSVVAFNFPRIISGPVSDDDLRNNSEIYVASIAPRPVGAATVVNAAAPQLANIAPGSIASIRGNALGTTVTVNGQAAQIFYASPAEVVFVVPSGLVAGSAEFLVTNADGLQSKAEAVISPTAPGVFNNAGEAIILNSDTLTRGPFDPSKGELRLSIFVTGVAQAGSVAVTINGKPVIVETVVPASLPGLDEIHVLIPAELRGAGTSTLLVSADDVQSNSASLVLAGATPTPTPTPIPSPSPSPSPTPTPGTSPHVVISQIFGGGGNSGAPFRNDFIEIFNAGNAPVNLNGWSVQYASATASTWSVTPLTSIILNPGQYYLIQESSGGTNGALLTAPDATGTIAMAAGSGKVVLIKTSTALATGCPNDPNIVDLTGYGNTANCFKGSAPAPTPSNTNAILRAAAGCTDTRNNVADFALGPPNPRNSNFLPRICSDP